MRKTLLAVAISGLLAPSFVHAQSANVTLYGVLNLSMEDLINVKQDGTSGAPGSGTPASGAKQSVFRVSSNISRFGMRGTESLGGGLNAIFQIESSIVADNSGGTLAARETFAGLQGPWGTVKLGYMFSPYYDTGSIFANTPTFRTSILATHALWGNNGYNGANIATGSFAQRHSNNIRYDSPDFSGFQGSAQIGGPFFMVEGTTEAGSTVFINDEEVDVEGNGHFKKLVSFNKTGQNAIVVKAVDPSGNQTVKSETVYVEE